MTYKQPQEIAEEISALISGDCFSDIFTRVAFSTDASIYQIIPLCVVAPKNANDVAAVVKYAYRMIYLLQRAGRAAVLQANHCPAALCLI